MIVGNVYNPEKALKHEDYAYKCWYNKKYDGNTLHISNQELQELESNWAHRMSKWQVTAESADNNDYEIDFDSENFDAGQETAKEVSGHDGKMGKSAAKNAAGMVGVAGTVVGASVAGCVASASAGFMVACPLALAVGILYTATRPNKKEHDALMQLKALMETGQTNMLNAQNDMVKTENYIIDKTKENQDEKDKSDEELAILQELIRTSQEVYNEIVARVNAGEPVSVADKAKLKEIPANIEALNLKCEALIQKSIDISETTEDSVDSKRSEYDNAAGVVEKESGITEFAAGFDKKTRDLCIAQAVTQGLNAAIGIAGAATAIALQTLSGGLTAAFAAMGLTGAGLSTWGVVEQSKFAKDLKGELDIRTNTQDTAVDTVDDIAEKTVNSELFLENTVAVTDYFSEIELPDTELDTVISTTTESESNSTQASGTVTPQENDDNGRKKPEETA